MEAEELKKQLDLEGMVGVSDLSMSYIESRLGTTFDQLELEDVSEIDNISLDEVDMRQILLGSFKTGLKNLKKKVHKKSTHSDFDESNLDDEQELIAKKPSPEKLGDFNKVRSNKGSSETSSDSDSENHITVLEDVDLPDGHGNEENGASSEEGNTSSSLNLSDE